MSKTDGFPKAEELRVINAGEFGDYLAVEDGKEMRFAMKLSRDSCRREEFENYVCAFNIGETTNLAMHNDLPMTSRELTPDQAADYERALRIMHSAKVYATAHWENEVFGRIK